MITNSDDSELRVASTNLWDSPACLPAPCSVSWASLPKLPPVGVPLRMSGRGTPGDGCRRGRQYCQRHVGPATAVRWLVESQRRGLADLTPWLQRYVHEQWQAICKVAARVSGGGGGAMLSFVTPKAAPRSRKQFVTDQNSAEFHGNYPRSDRGVENPPEPLFPQCFTTRM